MAGHRKQVKHYHDPGDLHELTFSCCERRPLLTNDAWRGYLAESIQSACCKQLFRLVAFVFMPEHVHLLVLPEAVQPEIDYFLAAVKRPCSVSPSSPVVDVSPCATRRGSRKSSLHTIR